MSAQPTSDDDEGGMSAQPTSHAKDGMAMVGATDGVMFHRVSAGNLGRDTVAKTSRSLLLCSTFSFYLIA